MKLYKHIHDLSEKGLSVREIADKLQNHSEGMKSQQIQDLHAQGLSIPEIAQRLDVSIPTVDRLLTLRPRSYSNPARNHLVQQTWQIRCQLGINWTAAAHRVIAETPLDVLIRASPNKQPITSRQLTNWSRPKK